MAGSWRCASTCAWARCPSARANTKAAAAAEALRRPPDTRVCVDRALPRQRLAHASHASRALANRGLAGEPCRCPDTLGAYTLREKLYDRQGIVEYRAVRASDQLPVLVKIFDPRWCRPRDVERLKNEFDLERVLDTAAAVRPLAFEMNEGMAVLVMEDVGGDSLDRRQEPMTVGRFLSLAVRMAAAVEEIHARGLVHRDLRPESFVVDATGEVRITSFGIASRLASEEMALRSPAQLIEGSLPYMSPEQTGRMNRPVDSRSDLYSLGVSFLPDADGPPPLRRRGPGRLGPQPHRAHPRAPPHAARAARSPRSFGASSSSSSRRSRRIGIRAPPG